MRGRAEDGRGLKEPTFCTRIFSHRRGEAANAWVAFARPSAIVFLTPPESIRIGPFLQHQENTMDRHATAVWSGNLKEGKGSLETQSGALKALPYNFKNRFEDESGK